MDVGEILSASEYWPPDTIILRGQMRCAASDAAAAAATAAAAAAAATPDVTVMAVGIAARALGDLL